MDYIPAGTFLTVYDSGQMRLEGHFFQDFINEIENGNIHPQIKKVFKLEEIVELSAIFLRKSTLSNFLKLNLTEVLKMKCSEF